MTDIDAFMDRAIALSRESLQKPGTAPFGCVVVRDVKIVGEGLNHSVAHYDPTSHGEVEAIRDACRNLKTLRLDDCDLYTSCEPCSLCVATMTLVGVRKLYYAASLDQSGPALAARMPTIDIPALRAESGSTLAERRMPSQQLKDAAVLEAWARA
ncbi:nucleoside deaminase [Terrarubrum flagellatum]|uniref:nucleoside deaminase n=1 Tax=Terrirubrum flagellatum TaxID=2895980 RepID=UPI003144EAAF